ncbi:MAG: enoyl-CoA hydratase/isomerase family protein [Pseudomonadales bacterium]|nr:enoyl-CoA hydratase/isomerase family protein [Pseudomonadales bacterium]
MPQYTEVHLTDGIGELVLNRPAQRNSLIGPLVVELREGLDRLVQDDECRAIIIRGAEGYFCAGLDLKAFSEDPAPEWRANFPNDWAMFHEKIFLSDKPIIGALEGFAIAGGSALALSCDFLIVGKGAFLHGSEVERGMFAPLNLAWLHIRHGYAKSLEMGLLGQRLYGERLYEMGVATRCVADDAVLEASRETAARFASFSTDAVQQLKRGMRQLTGVGDFMPFVDRIKAV